MRVVEIATKDGYPILTEPPQLVGSEYCIIFVEKKCHEKATILLTTAEVENTCFEVKESTKVGIHIYDCYKYYS